MTGVQTCALPICLRHKASYIFLLQITHVADHFDKLDCILNSLQSAYELDEDSDRNVLVTFANYFSNVVLNTGQFHSSVLQSVIKGIKANESDYGFLNNKFVKKLFSIDFSDTLEANLCIQTEIEYLFSRSTHHAQLNVISFIESNTPYSLLLNTCKLSFEDIRQLSVKQLNCLTAAQRDELHKSLLRGVKILEAENELHAYMLFYGKMHYEKLRSSFHFLPQLIFKNRVSIIDWGCGQGMASMSLKDYLNLNNIECNISNVILIEPSEFALKRASLHVRKYFGNINISTLKKDLDTLIDNDFEQNLGTKIHLFSNILDVELFSLTNLIKLVKAAFPGENYFVCASPYVNDLKTRRLDGFMTSFSKCTDYLEIVSITNKRGEWSGTNWARVIRVFKVTL